MIRFRLMRLVALGALWVLTTGGGCNYFAPAKPEPPAPGVVIDAIYTDTESTLETIRRAIEAKGLGNGSAAYAGGFADSTEPATPGFHQFFWPEEQRRWEDITHRIAPDWDFDYEQNFYTKFIQLRSEPYKMEWGPDDNAEPDDIDDAAGRALIHRHYRVIAESEDQSTSLVIAIGYADLTFIKFPSGDWKITRWDDRPDPLADPAARPDEVTLGQRRLDTL